MGVFNGGFLRIFQTFLYAITFCCAAIILGIYSYFLAWLHQNNVGIARWENAVEGIAGIAVIYTVFAVVLTCCLAGITFFAFLGVLLDVLFIGGMIAIAVMTRHGATACTGYVNTPLGSGDAETGTTGNKNAHINLRLACKLNTAAFAVAIIAAIIFAITAVMQIALARHHKKEKRFGPSPANNYTSGYGKRKFWQRRNRGEQDGELGGVAAQPEIRPSHETGSTVAASGGAHHLVKDEAQPAAHGGYYTQPTGTGVANPYGYENPTHSAGTATNY